MDDLTGKKFDRLTAIRRIIPPPIPRYPNPSKFAIIIG